jgi:hypothetical protein
MGTSGGRQSERAKRLACCLLVATTSIWLHAAPVLAQDSADGFRSPTGNIQCMFFDDDASIRCNIADKTTPLPPRPQDCELDWGNDFSLDETSRRGVLMCVGDTIVGDYPELAYGETFERGNISCVSERSGVTCTNGRGAGFALSRAQQLLF